MTRADGNVDVWDLLDKYDQSMTEVVPSYTIKILYEFSFRSHEPSLTQNVTSALITSVNPYQVSSE